MSEGIQNAFILGAGLGTRLLPLTERLPKPLIPVWNKPLITYAFDHLLADIPSVEAFLVNTHHCPAQYERAFPKGNYRGRDLNFRNEPVLLETAGGIANILDWLPDQSGHSFIVYNGDILTDLPLGRAVAAHEASDNLVTLVLRSGDGGNVAMNDDRTQVIDLRNSLGTNAETLFQFTGIYLVRTEFLPYLTVGKKESVVLPFLEVLRRHDRGGIGGVVIDDGIWSDLGTREAYLDGSLQAGAADFPTYGRAEDQVRLHPYAMIDPSADICPQTTIGEGAAIGARARLENCILWPGATIAEGASLTNCIVRGGETATGALIDADL